MTKCTRCHAKIVPFDILRPRWRVLTQLPGGEIIPRPLCEKCQEALCEWVFHSEEENEEPAPEVIKSLVDENDEELPV